MRYGGLPETQVDPPLALLTPRGDIYVQLHLQAAFSALLWNRRGRIRFVGVMVPEEMTQLLLRLPELAIATAIRRYRRIGQCGVW